MSDQAVGVIWTATAEVVPATDPFCVDVHPGEPCPGLPHDDEEQP